MTLRLIAFCVCLLPTATLAQQSTSSGGCDYARSCPAGKIMDSSTKACVDVAA